MSAFSKYLKREYDIPEIDFLGMGNDDKAKLNAGTFVDLWSTWTAYQNGQASEAQLKAAIEQSGEGNAAALAMMMESKDLASEGSEVQASALSTMLENYGAFGQISPEILAEFETYLATAKSDEKSNNNALVAEALAAYKSGTADMSEADIERLNTLETTYRNLGGKDLENTFSSILGRDETSQANAPELLDMANQHNMVARNFYEMRNNISDRAISEQYEAANVDLPEGMRDSTMGVQLQKARMDLANRARQENLLQAFSDADSYMQSVGNSTTTNQQLGMNERNMGRNLRSDAVNENSVGFTNAMTGGQYGQSYFGVEKGLDGLNLEYLNTLKNLGITDVNNINSMYSSSALDNRNNAMTLMANTADTAQGYMTNTMNIMAQPYTYAAGGYNNASNAGTGTLNNLSNNLKYTQDYAIASGDAFGQSYDTLSKKLYNPTQKSASKG